MLGKIVKGDKWAQIWIHFFKIGISLQNIRGPIFTLNSEVDVLTKVWKGIHFYCKAI